MGTKKRILPYNPFLKERARELRNKGTLSEAILWNHLKKKQILGFDFDRQKPIGNFIVDFFCSELMLVIEVDGESHEDKAREDQEREMNLEKKGLHFLRFTDEQVKRNVQAVVWTIEDWIRQHRPTPAPLPRGDLH